MIPKIRVLNQHPFMQSDVDLCILLECVLVGCCLISTCSLLITTPSGRSLIKHPQSAHSSFKIINIGSDNLPHLSALSIPIWIISALTLSVNLTC